MDTPRNVRIGMENMSNIPPVVMICQWIPWFTCCRLHNFTLFELTFGRSLDGGLHAYVMLVVLGFGIRLAWHNRQSRIRFLAEADQIEAMIKDAVREKIAEEWPNATFEGDDEDAEGEEWKGK